MPSKPTLKFFFECSERYIDDTRAQIPELPEKYVYPTGNPIRPVLPVETVTGGIMLIGAFPSARFHYLEGKLVPVADNLAPFAKEVYFDGRGIRKQASRESLEEHYFGPNMLNLCFEDMWVTDLVKVYLFPDKHIKNCEVVAPQHRYVNTHKMFGSGKTVGKLAKASVPWIRHEIELCNPKLIITLGETAARAIQDDRKTDNKQLLSGL